MPEIVEFETFDKSSSDSSLLHENIRIYEVKDQTYWFKDFSTDAWLRTKSYFEQRKVFDGSVAPSNPNWFLFVLLFCFSIIAFVRAFHRKRVVLISKILLNWKLGKQIIRYEKVYTHPVNLALILNFLIVLPLFTALCISRIPSIEYSILGLSFYLFIALLGFQILRFVIYLFSAWLFDEKELIDEYVFHVNLLSKFQGLAILILLVLLLYTSLSIQIIVYSALLVFLASLILQLLRGFRVGFQKTKNIVLIILYLCTLEILPLLILSKKVIQVINFS